MSPLGGVLPGRHRGRLAAVRRRGPQPARAARPPPPPSTTCAASVSRARGPRTRGVVVRQRRGRASPSLRRRARPRRGRPVTSLVVFNLGGPEVLVILLLALIVLGPQRLPDAARQVGRVMRRDPQDVDRLPARDPDRLRRARPRRRPGPGRPPRPRRGDPSPPPSRGDRGRGTRPGPAPSRRSRPAATAAARAERRPAEPSRLGRDGHRRDARSWRPGDDGGDRPTPGRHAARATPADDDGRMSLMEHLTELRSRLIKCVVAVAVGALVGFIAYQLIFDFLIDPYQELCSRRHRRSGVQLLRPATRSRASRCGSRCRPTPASPSPCRSPVAAVAVRVARPLRQGEALRHAVRRRGARALRPRAPASRTGPCRGAPVPQRASAASDLVRSTRRQVLPADHLHDAGLRHRLRVPDPPRLPPAASAS